MLSELFSCSYESAGNLHIAAHRRIGVTHSAEGVQVPKDARILVTQVFCSAISVAYSGQTADEWEPLARAVLNAAYEGTLLTAAKDVLEGVGSGVVFLTLVGGGVFGNELSWIADAIAHAMLKCKDMPLDVRICHYRRINESVKAEVEQQIQKRSAV